MFSDYEYKVFFLYIMFFLKKKFNLQDNFYTMKIKIFLILFFCCINFLMSQSINDSIEKINYLKNVKIEDANGRLLTSLEEKQEFLNQRNLKIKGLQSKQINKNVNSLTPVYLCSNGTFEEYSQVSGNNIVKDFEFVENDLLNPAQCRDILDNANQYINQYNPANMSIMATTVPANHLDEYIGDIQAFDQYALKINYKNSYNLASKVQGKRFKTNNENILIFNFKAVLQSVEGDAHENEQPFFKARIVDKNGVVVSEFCLIGDVNNCIFVQAPNLEGDSIVLYTPNWQTGILDISSIPNNEEFYVEFQASRCGLSGHFGYVYLDDICTRHSNEGLQGSIELDPLNKICPTLPISVCGTFTLPTSGVVTATVSSIVLQVYDANNAVVYTSTTPASLDLATKRFCFDITAANLPNTTTGTYNVGVTINYGISDTACTGTSFSSASDNDANPGWDIWFLNCTNCPLTVLPAQLYLCDTNNDGKEIFNLNNANSQIVATTTGLTFEYFTTIADATAGTNPISTPTAYQSYSTTLFVRVNQSATCYKIIALQLVVKNPHATISGVLNICYGSTVLTASAGNAYLWNTGETTQSITVSAIGSYSVQVTDSFGCVSTGTVTINNTTVAPQPTITIVQPTCSVTTGSFTVTSPASQYSYDSGNTWVTTNGLTNLAVGNYTVMIRTLNGCTSYDSSINIVPFQSSFPDFSSVQPTFCGDLGSITITSVAYEYSFDDGVTWTTNNTATGLNPGLYYIRTRDAQGCISNYNAVYLYSEFLEKPLYTKLNPYCGNLGSITITTAAADYSFDGGTTWQSSNTLTGLSTGSYLIMVRDSQGCTSPVEYVYLTDLEYTYPDYTIEDAGCNKYGSITINTLADFYSFDGGTTWSTTNSLSNQSGPLSYSIIVKMNGGCTSYTSYATLSTSFILLPPVNDYETTECDNLNDGSESINLSLYNANIIANTSNYNFNYFTNENDALDSNATNWIQNYTGYTMSNQNNTVYVRVTDSSTGCIDVAKLKINFIDSPRILQIQDLYAVCKNKNIYLDAGYGFDAYLWSTGQTTRGIYITSPGSYSITVFKNHPNGLICQSTKTFNVFLSDYASITHIQTIDWTDIDNVITIYVDGISEYEYSLDGIHFQDSNEFTGLPVGIYEVFVRDKFGCGTVSEHVFLLNYPRFFTPNTDGNNDNWKVKFAQYEPGLTTEIFDRTGKLIKFLKYNESWDGMYNGELAPSDDYWFLVKRADGKIFKGHFAMKR